LRPKYCPNCGKPLRSRSSAVKCVGPGGSEVWDCYCRSCGWSGDISPDEKLGEESRG